MTSISVIIITYNEEQNLERCLRSVQGIADEIVVVDSFSTDQTEAICRKYAVHFIQHAFDGYVEQKNWAMGQATFPYVLSLDADEALSAELRKSILQVKENWSSDGYIFSRMTNYCGKWIRHGSWYPDYKLRLWDKRKGQWTGVKIHEKVELQTPFSTKVLEGDLLHYSYYSISQHIDQANKFTDITAIEAFQRKKKASALKICINPCWKFIRDYIVKLGFLDGYYGFVVCYISAFATYLKYAKLRQLYEKQRSA